ncbi:hypothetical protein Acr_00g0051320 [Actinidia rufa]|uniref:Uncharacterized protein n=1 Tax=Actinidia rufa TaxID=165716 RepID=A0A7J0DMC4_9ERIC|nr:hypothetical protein Acr_00g0051320 [Actinidia rufa]
MAFIGLGQADHQRQPRLPPLCIRERASWVGIRSQLNGSSSFDLFDLDDEDVGEWAEGVVGDEEEDNKVKKGKKVNQVRDPVLAIASPVQISVGAKLVQPSPNLVLAFPSLAMEVQSNAPSSKGASKRKGKKHVTNVDTSKDHKTCLAFGNAVMLPQDMVAELRPSIFQEGWLACLKELGTPSDHLAWNAVNPLIEPLDLPIVYSPLILSGFNEEEYMNQPVDDEGVAAIEEVGKTQGNELIGSKGKDAEGADGEGIGKGDPSTKLEE